jgi:hypothetical protein
MQAINVTHNNKTVSPVQVDELPDICPWCHKGCHPNPVIAFKLSEPPEDVDEAIQAIFRCPMNNCGKLFIVDYFMSRLLTLPGYTFGRMKAWPQRFNPAEIHHPETVKKLSPRSVLTYQQAYEAQKTDLSEIAGMGYRKALEILIKDYLVFLEPEKEEAIKGMELMNCIANKVTDPNLKICAERAAWLGNDHSHYLAKFTDHNISHLIELIRLAENWIDSSLRTAHFATDMTSKKTK